MSQKYTLTHKILAYILSLSLCLQSCGGDNLNQLVPQEKKQTEKALAISKQNKKSHEQIKQLVSEKSRTIKGDITDPNEEINGVEVILIENLKDAKRTYGSPVQVASDSNLGPLSQQQGKVISQNPTSTSQPASRLIFKPGLLGGMKKGGANQPEKGLVDNDLELRKYLRTENLEITPQNCEYLLELTKKEEYSSENNKKELALTGWDDFNQLGKLIELLTKFSQIEQFKHIKQLTIQGEVEKQREAELIEVIIIAIGCFKSLEKLGLRECKLSRAGLQDIRRAIETNRAISIIVNDNNVSPDTEDITSVVGSTQSTQNLIPTRRSTESIILKQEEKNSNALERNLPSSTENKQENNQRPVAFLSQREQKEQAEDADCQFDLGHQYYLNKNYSQAKECFEKAAKQEHAEALYYIGHLYYHHGKGIPQNFAKALEYWERAAVKGNVKAQENLANLKKLVGFLILLNVARLQGEKTISLQEDNPTEDADHQFNIGYQYYLNRDFIQAEEWLKKAAAQGHVEAQYKLGELYLDKEYLSNFEDFIQTTDLKDRWGKLSDQKDHGIQWLLGFQIVGECSAKLGAKARELWEIAAAQGHTEAQYKLGLLYFEGKNVPRNLTTAREWWKMAATQGHARAQYRLGLLYLHGDGVPTNISTAKEWLEKAAIQGYIMAQYEMGNYYYNLNPKDYLQALEWYTKAALQGHKAACGMLIGLYKHGQGVPQDEAKASMWEGQWWKLN